jgi:hypothetical protein
MERNEVVPDRETALEMLRRAAALEPPRRPGKGAQQAMTEKNTPRQSTTGLAQIDGIRQPCRCGSCRICLDNARWERVFNEKFADAEYYGGLRLSSRSPLAAF